MGGVSGGIRIMRYPILSDPFLQPPSSTSTFPLTTGPAILAQEQHIAFACVEVVFGFCVEDGSIRWAVARDGVPSRFPGGWLQVIRGPHPPASKWLKRSAHHQPLFRSTTIRAPRWTLAKGSIPIPRWPRLTRKKKNGEVAESPRRVGKSRRARS